MHDAGTRPTDTAVHEAGHCVVAAFYGNRGHGISITAEGDSRGRFKSGFLPRGSLPEVFHRSHGAKMCRVALAGALAQVMGMRRTWRPWVSHGDEALLEEGLVMEGHLSDAARSVAVYLHEQAVRRLLRRPSVWSTVLAIAAALDVEREMDSGRLLDFLDDLPGYMTDRHDYVRSISDNLVLPAGENS